MLPGGPSSKDESGEKFAAWGRAVGPRGLWRPLEARVAEAGGPLCMRACREAGAAERFLKPWFQGVEVELPGEPPLAVSEDYLSVRDQPPAATGLDRLAAMKEILGTPGVAAPRISGCVRPS